MIFFVLIIFRLEIHFIKSREIMFWLASKRYKNINEKNNFKKV